MRNWIFLMMLMMASFCVLGQTGTMDSRFVLAAQFGASSVVNDSTFQVSCTHSFSQLDVEFLPADIEVGFIAVSPTGRRYRVSSIVGTPSLNSGTYNLVELQDQNIPPTGAGLIYDPGESGDFILFEVLLERISPAFQTMILNHNILNAAELTQEVIDTNVALTDPGFVAAENVGEALTENRVNILTIDLLVGAVLDALGISPLDEEMGVYPGSLISDNADQVTVNTELEAGIEANAANIPLNISDLNDDIGILEDVTLLLNYDSTRYIIQKWVNGVVTILDSVDIIGGNVSADGVTATPHGNIIGTTVQAQLEQLVASTDFGRVWYCSKSSGNNATGEVGNYFAPFRDPYWLIDSVQAGDLVFVIDGMYQVNLLSNAEIFDNPVAGVYPILGRNGVTYYWSPGSGIEEVGGCPTNTGFFRCGVLPGAGFIADDFPEGTDNYKLSIVGNGTFRGATLYHYAMQGNGLVPGTSRQYPPRSVYIQCDTIDTPGAHIELYGGDINIFADIKTVIATNQCTGGGRAVFHFGSFGSQSAFRVDSITGIFNVGEVYISSDGGTAGNVNYPVFGNSGTGGSSRDFSDLDLTLNVDYLKIDSTSHEGAFVQWVSGTTAERVNISVNGKTVVAAPSSTSAFIDIEGVVSGAISVNVDNAELGIPLFTDDGGPTSVESLEVRFDGNYRLNDVGARYTGTGRTSGRRIIFDGVYTCNDNFVRATTTQSDLPSQTVFLGTAFGNSTDTLFVTGKDIFYFGNSFSDLPLFRSSDDANIFLSKEPAYTDYDGAVRVDQGADWKIEVFTATASQTVFTVSDGILSTNNARVRVYDDSGAKLRETDHYTYVAATGTVTLATPATAGEKYTVEYFQ